MEIKYNPLSGKISSGNMLFIVQTNHPIMGMNFFAYSVESIMLINKNNEYRVALFRIKVK